MGILDTIKSKLFGKSTPQPEKPAAAASTASAAPKPAATSSGYVPGGSSNSTLGGVKPAASFASAPAPAAAPVQPVDIEAILDAAVAAKGVKLNWRQSIVDLLKALDLDSSLAARKELAADLKYSGTHADGTAEKNIWLHKELMKQLSENGGKIPKELLK